MKNKILILLVAIMLCACGSKPGIIYSDEQDKEKIDIHFLGATTNGKEVTIFDTLIKEFQKDYDNIQILFESFESSGNNKTLADLIDQRMEKGKANDIVTMDVANIYEYAAQEKLFDLSDSEIGKSLNAYARQDSLVNGKVMSLPLSMTSYCMWVNMDIMEECNLDLPTNWEEFLNCCKVLKSKGYQPLVGIKNFPKLFILSCLGDIYMRDDTDEIVAKLNSGEEKVSQYTKVGMEHLKELIDNDYINAQEAIKYMPTDGKQLFEDKQGVFLLETSSGIDPDEFSFEISLTGIPGSDEMVSLLASDRRMVVMEDSEYVDECVSFLSYLSNSKVQEVVAKSFGTISAFTDDIDVSEVDSREKAIYEIIEEERVMLIQDYNLKFEQWRNLNEIANALLEGQSVESQLVRFDEIQREAIEKNN